MKKIKDLILGKKFFVPDRGLIEVVQIENETKYTGVDGTFDRESILNIYGKFQYYSLDWWKLNKEFFDVKKFVKNMIIFTFDGHYEKILDIKHTSSGTELYNDCKMFDFAPKNSQNYTWFRDIKNLKGNHKISLMEYADIDLTNIPTQYVETHPELIELSNKIESIKSKKYSKTLLGEII